MEQLKCSLAMFKRNISITSKSLRGVISNDEWVQKDFTTLVAKRGAAIIDKRKMSSAASAANAICDHIHDWVVGTEPGYH